MPACRDCGSVNIEPDAPTEDGYYSILATLSDQIPSEQHCDDWLEGKGIGADEAEQTATAMLASLRYDPKKAVWVRGRTEYVNIWAVFQSWCLRDLRQNGARSKSPYGYHPAGSGLKIKEGGRY